MGDTADQRSFPSWKNSSLHQVAIYSCLGVIKIMPKYTQSNFANAVENVPPVDFVDQAKFHWCQANELLLINSAAPSYLTNSWKKTKKLAQIVARATNSTEMVWAYDDLKN
ncbi:hypothetical protein N9B41_01090, partial [bacterium]|nr:hypothetical protein [bacterium]